MANSYHISPKPAVRTLVGLALSAALFSAPGLAQISSQGGPIRVNADRSSVFERERRVDVVGNVDIVQGQARLRADEVTLFYSSGTDGATGGPGAGFGAIDRMVADGEVFYITPDLKARGDSGNYDAATDTITLEDNVVLIRCEDVARGERLTIEVTAGRTTLDGGEQGRVQMVIVPGSDEAPADCAPIGDPATSRDAADG
ncbi:MAG: LptA/OstA family protein [Pseudomonadota bacterium]